MFRKAGAAFFFINQVYSASFVIQKHVYSNQAGGCFLVYSGTIVIWKHVTSNQAGGCYF